MAARVDLDWKYRCTNLAAAPFDFFWNIHPALAISPATRLDLPARRGLTDPWSTDLCECWTEIGFGMAFPTAVLPHLWLFRAYGGWRGLYTLIVETSTGYPNRLEAAREGGHCGHLEPGETLEAEVTAVVYTGLTSVQAVQPDGQVR